MVKYNSDKESKRLSEVLFNNKAYQVLAHLFENSDRKLSISEIEEAVDVSRPVISNLINDLRDLGLVSKEKKGNLYLISIISDSPYYEYLEHILDLDAEPLRNAVTKLVGDLEEEGLLSGIASIYLFGSVARGIPKVDSDIDLLFISNSEFDESDKKDICNFVSKQEKNQKVSFSITWYDREELKSGLASGIVFVERVVEEGIKLYGEDIW